MSNGVDEEILESSGHKIQLENFYGPLDLLLYLIKESELNIYNIPIASIADQYISYIQTMQKLDINLAGEFLVMASKLMLIKSRSLVPAAEEQGEEEEEDPSIELIRKLIEYKKFKDRAKELEKLYLERAKRLGRPELAVEEDGKKVELRNLDLWNLVLMYSRLSKQISLDTKISILYSDIPIEVFIKNILEMLSKKKNASFIELVGDRKDKSKVIGTFLALLELTKEQKIRSTQMDDKSDINIELVT